MNRIPLTLSFDPRLLFQVAFTLVCTTMLTGALCTLLVSPSEPQQAYAFFSFMGQGGEHTMPALVSSFMLLTASVLALLVPVQAAGKMLLSKGMWHVLSLVLFLLSVNETVSLHQVFTPYLIVQVEGVIGQSPFTSALVTATATLFLVFLFISPLRALSGPLRKRVLLSLFLFLLGAVGMETAGGMMALAGGTSTIAYRVTVVAEESLELLGVLYLLSCLLVHLANLQKAAVVMQVSYRKQEQVSA